MLPQITDQHIQKARLVLDNPTVKPLTREGALESGMFCICSQGTEWEVASKFIYGLRRRSYPRDKDYARRYASKQVLTDKEAVNATAVETRWRFHHNKRFDQFIDYFGSREGEWWLDVRDASFEQRRKIVQEIKYLSNKTLDFWMLCLGRNSIALDVHVMKRLHGLGVELNPHFYTAVARNVGTQKVRKTPSDTEYTAIEQAARELFAKDKRFYDGDSLNIALVDAVLWWDGAKRDNLNQGHLFTQDRSELILPYAGQINGPS